MTKPAVVVRTTSIAVGAAYAAALYLSGVHIQAGWKQALSYLPTVLTLLLTLWDIWLWRQPPFHRFVQRPLLLGTWQVWLKPTAESHIPSGGNRGPIEAYVVIDQSYWSITIRQYTAESHSDSKAYVWTGEEGGARSLIFVYANTPKHEFEARSRAHLGTTLLDIVGVKPEALTGCYFTDRYTKGDMELTLCDRSVDHASFDIVRQHCQRN